MDGPVGIDRAARSHQRLPDNLTAEDPHPTLVRARSAKKISLYLLQLQHADEIGDHRGRFLLVGRD